MIKLQFTCTCEFFMNSFLIYFKNISDEGLIAMANSCHSLNYLNISLCTRVTDATLLALGRQCHELSIFEASGCILLTDPGFINLSKVYF